MVPAKPRSGADDHRGEATSTKDKNGHGHGHGHGHTNGNGHPPSKSRRTANSNASSAANNHSSTGPTGSSAATSAAASAQQQQQQQQQQQLANGGVNGTTNATQTTANAPPSIQWMGFERNVLNAYIRAYQIDSPAAFSNDFHHWILSQPGSIGLQSPTMRRHKDLRRQSKAQLANTTRKHSNNLGVQENDVIVDFLHKVQNHEVERLRRLRRNGSNARGREG